MGKQWKWLATFFAVFGILAALLGAGTITQVNGIANAARNFFDPNLVHTVTIPGIGTYSWAVVISSFVVRC